MRILDADIIIIFLSRGDGKITVCKCLSYNLILLLILGLFSSRFCCNYKLSKSRNGEWPPGGLFSK